MRYLLAKLLTISFSLLWMPGLSAHNVCAESPKIAIIGAGISGLTAAKFLQRKGYQDLVVYEKNAEIGGKVETYYYEGVPYDMGAVIIHPAWTELIKEAQALQVEMKEIPRAFEIVEDRWTYTVEEFLAGNYQPIELLQASARYVELLTEHPEIRQQGLAGTSPHLSIPMSDFLELEPKIFPLFDAMRPFYVGYGYGFYEETPAIYYLKLMYFQFRKQLEASAENTAGQDEFSNFVYFPRGFQNFLAEFAKGLNVRLNAKVSSVRRVKEGSCSSIWVTANDQTERYDQIIIATPLSAASQYLDLDEFEESLFKQVQTYNYYSILYKADFLPSSATFFYRQNQFLDRKGRVLASSDYRGAPLQTLWLNAPYSFDQAAVEGAVKEHMEAEGGTLREIVKINRWDYFPHIDSEGFRSGFFEKMESLQGKKTTYYLSSVMNLETTIHSYLYAKQLIEEHF